MNKEQFSIVSDILKLLSIQSFTGDELGIRKCQEFIVALATKMGFCSSFHGSGKVLIIEPKHNKAIPKLGIVVHVDTVPYEEKNWKHNPLGEISESRIYGRGIIDDKGPIILAMYAMYSLREEIDNSWQIIIGSSEEDEWIDMEEFLKEIPTLPSFLVTIDGDGVLNGCRGYLDLSLSFLRETSGKKHITNFFVPNGMKNTVPKKAFAEIDGNLVAGFGKEVHSSIPEQGSSAITDLAINIKKDFSEPYAEYSKMFDFLEELHNNHTETSIGLSLIASQEVGTSVSATTAVMEGECIQINLNVRLGPGRGKTDVYSAISYISSKYGCKIDIQKLILPSYIDPNQKEFQAMSDAYNEVLNTKPNITIAKGLGYNAALPNCAIFGPRFDVNDDDEPDSCHQADENRSLENLFKFYEILKKFLRKVL